MGPTPTTASPINDRDQPLPGARLALALLLSINLFNYLDRQILAAVVTSIRDEFFPGGEIVRDGSVAVGFVMWMKDTLGFEPQNALIGSLALAFMAAYMCLAPLFGWLAERTRRWLLVGIGVILWSLASGGTGLAQTFGILFLTRCFVGLGEAAYGPVAPAMLSDLYPVKQRGGMLSWFYAAMPVGSALGYVLGGAILSATDSWRIPFYCVVPPGILLGLVCFFMREPPRGRVDLAPGQLAHKPRKADYLVLLKTPSYVLCSLGMTAAFFAIGGIAFWMPDYLHNQRGLPNLGQVNLIFGGIVVVSGLVATLLGGMAGDRLRTRYPGSYFLVSSLGMFIALPFFFASLYLPFPLGWVTIFFAVFFLFFNTGPTDAILANVTHPSIRATGFALNIFVIHAFGDAISPMIIGAIADKYSLQTGFQVVSGMIFVAGMLWLAGVKFLQRDTERAPRSLASAHAG